MECVNGHDAEAIYAKRKAQADSSYAQITVASMICCAVGVAISLVSSVLVGMALCLISAAVYKCFSTMDIYKLLGIKFEGRNGSAHITRLAPFADGVAVIPSRIAWYDVSAVDAEAIISLFEHPIREIYIPISIRSVGAAAFISANDTNNPLIRYEGSQDDWSHIEGSAQFSCCEMIFEYPMPKRTQKRRSRRAEI